MEGHLMHNHTWSAMRGHLPPVPPHSGAPRSPAGFGGGWEGFFPGRGPRGFGPAFGPGGPRARRGDVRSAILGLLADGSSNGYGLIRSIAERTEGGWTPSPGSVYPTLAQLVDEGLVSQADGPRGAYSLTDSGREYVEQHRDEIDNAFENARGDRRDDELIGALKKLAGAVMQFRGGVTPEQRARATEKVDELRRELYRILGE
jgi:DNA-binding PadR family transcriptional regulator